MPIRFRCVYCNQLMGIARRKAASVVRCPKCQGQVVVPTPEGMESSEAADAEDKKDNVFEQSDFSKFLSEGTPAPLESSGHQVSSAAPKAMKPAPQVHAPMMPETGALARGIFFTPGTLTLLGVLVVLLLGVAFFFGLLLGRSSGG
jgi:phage FluMu protein Com